MDHPIGWKIRLTLAMVAALAATPVPTALAAAPAGDEYVLEIPGVRQADSGAGSEAAAGGGSVGGRAEQRGVVGEADAPQAPLGALGDTLTAAPTPIVVGLAALLAIVMLAAIGRRPVSNGSR